jgi:hypothetical protein
LEGRGLISRLWGNDSRRFDFAVFSAGTFTKRSDRGQTYIASKEHYPRILWKIINKAVGGGWFN